MTKILTQPLVIFLFWQIIILILCSSRLLRRKSIGGLIATSFVAVLLLAVLAMPTVGDFLLRSVALPPSEIQAPDLIVVLSGGLDEGVSPDLDALSAETTQRVLFAVRYWKMHPSARIVMSGASYGQNSHSITNLMAELARCRGIPSASILVDPNSRNTSQHPLRVRALPGVTPATRLAIVTSGYHERRAVAEFRRYFQFVVPQPVPALRNPHDWIPDNRGLVKSTAAIQEWIGIVWYRILAASHRTPV